MSSDYRTGETALSFMNFNYSIERFYTRLTTTSLLVIESKELPETYKQIFSFISEFAYGLPNQDELSVFLTELETIRSTYETDPVYQELFYESRDTKESEILKRKYYYDKYIPLLQILGKFLSKLKTTLMPKLTTYQSLVGYSNTNIFLEKFYNFMYKVSEHTSTFRVTDFSMGLNSIICLTYVFDCFILSSYKKDLREYIDIFLQAVHSPVMIDIFMTYPRLTDDEQELLRSFSVKSIKLLHQANTRINISHSRYGLSQKIRKPELEDKTLI